MKENHNKITFQRKKHRVRDQIYHETSGLKEPKNVNVFMREKPEKVSCLIFLILARDNGI